MNVTSPKSSLVKLGLYPRQKSLRVMVIGQSGVGKSAMVVRFITRRYIGEYDPTLEKIYTYHAMIDNEMVYFEILDTAGQLHESESLAFETNIRWAEAFILMYSVTDKCSFDECYRLKFLINYNKRKRRIGSSPKDGIADVPVVLVGNKIDQVQERMVSVDEGQRRSKEIGCVCFHEISVRESIDQVTSVFSDVCRFWRVQNKCPSKIRRSASDQEPTSPESRLQHTSMISPGNPGSRRWTDVDLDEEDKAEAEGKNSVSSSPGEATPFRERASTDGNLFQRPWRWRYGPSTSASGSQAFYPPKVERRMSISMRGNNASC